jgi:hypothetical protein
MLCQSAGLQRGEFIPESSERLIPMWFRGGYVGLLVMLISQSSNGFSINCSKIVLVSQISTGI